MPSGLYSWLLPTLLGPMLVLAGACKRGVDLDRLLEVPSAGTRAQVPAGALPGEPSDLEQAVQQPWSSLPDWLESCQIFQQPVEPGMGDSSRVGLICGPHAVLIASLDRKLFPATDAQARSQAAALLGDGLETRLETRPVRDGVVGVEVVRAGGQVLGMAAGSETAERVIGLACGGPDGVQTRAAFCELIIGSLLAVPTGGGAAGSVAVGEVSMGLPASDEARAYFARVDPAVPLDTWTAVVSPVRITADGRFSGEVEDATRIASWLIGESELLFCLSKDSDVLHRYPRRGVVELAWIPGQGGQAFIGGQDPPILGCLQSVLPRLADQVRPPGLPVRLQLGLEVVRTAP